MDDLHLLPTIRDSWSYLYVEHCRIEQEGKAIALIDERGKTPVPCATLMTLLLGPGTSITHAAVRALAENGCLVIWAGEEGVRCYAQGLGETRSSRNVLWQAWQWADPARRLDVVMRMYRMRFAEPLPPNLTLRQLRGREGMRVRWAYERASRETGVPWYGRSYQRNDWRAADPVNRALSCANSCLYGICHAAIVAAGFSPAIGFIHTGRMLSFVYDIADLYKTEISIPIAFRVASEGEEGLEMRVRHACRDAFRESRLLSRIIPDIGHALGMDRPPEERAMFDDDVAAPGGLWDPEGEVAGGVNWADEREAGEDEA
ncbi:type I-E CRISPR-associated endonuclease Cas1e [Thermomicrobiaceae bacterium CFH 74404]|uniref:CRISPR-associated endonuclease Cas1 n=1 Tax=Thermalbibacter longus TaxID=2951981 RepID=A0AA41WAU8_9BACT|nr:type I-E CRISPR-associated endonuclease Cas1e [Thermalbibacter longus]MCM8749096.1 type I-E CRISPR-associated endonuclease Cas1e [Thermalbibacter longus]